MTKKNYHHGDLRAALLDAARAEIARSGVHALNLRTLAKTVGVSEAAPYHHFKGRDGLLSALLADGYRQLVEAFEEALRGPEDPFDRLRAIGRTYARFGLQNRGYFRGMFGAHVVALPEDLKPYEQGRASWTMHTEVCAAAAESMGRPDLGAAVARTSWSMIHGITWLLTEDEIRPAETGKDADQLIEEALDVLIAGIRAWSTS